jgi:hypothetical protein
MSGNVNNTDTFLYEKSIKQMFFHVLHLLCLLKPVWLHRIQCKLNRQFIYEAAVLFG